VILYNIIIDVYTKIKKYVRNKINYESNRRKRVIFERKELLLKEKEER